MTRPPVYIAGTGIISGLGGNVAETAETLRANRSALQPLSLFPLLQSRPLPVGQAPLDGDARLPRTHRLALAAARQAMAGNPSAPEMIVLGTTTGGILTTEELLYRGGDRKDEYRYHGLTTVVDYLARELGCLGPALTVSTACSSGAVALTLALRLLRSGRAETVLAGGVDSLCRLTYFGFHSLQLVDQAGCRPLDRDRQGMAVAEGAGMLLLTTRKPAEGCPLLLGAGLSCDAYHPAAPHPDGLGAFRAMAQALADAGLGPEAIEYINLHGTGTPDNDRAEAKALHRLFPVLPPLSSIKGASGHSLAAAGAIEAVVATLAIREGLVPANTGLATVDPLLDLDPVVHPTAGRVDTVLSNSFGFGGNNGSIVIGHEERFRNRPADRIEAGLFVHALSGLTGAGDLTASLATLYQGQPVAGTASLEQLTASLPSRLVRRLKRLPRLTLGLAAATWAASPGRRPPSAVLMGTGWGALSETHDFLHRLRESNEQFPSPTDFVGSVHNGPASQVAILLGATGANLTLSGGDRSFEQALLAAEQFLDRSSEPALLLGADEAHPVFSPLLDGSIDVQTPLADGGAAFAVSRHSAGALCRLTLPFFQEASGPAVELLAERLRQKLVGTSGYAAILTGIPAAERRLATAQLDRFRQLTGLSVPLIDYRRLTGEFASASAVATALAAALLQAGTIPAALTGTGEQTIDGTGGLLVLGLGQQLTALEVTRP